MKHEKRTDYITLYAQGLDEGIRCAMCTNSMANDRGCDGGCVVDTAMYERVLKVIKECTVPDREKETDLDHYTKVKEWAKNNGFVLVTEEWYNKARVAYYWRYYGKRSE